MEQYIVSLDKILSEINEATLTEEEVVNIAPVDSSSLQEKYDILNKILFNRGDFNAVKKLRAKASVDNIEISKPKKDFNNMLFCFGVDKIKEIKGIVEEEEPIYYYSKKERKSSFLYYLEYNNLDYEKGIEFANEFKPKEIGGCSALRKDNYLIRSFDWNFTDDVEFIILNKGSKYKNISISGNVKELNKDFVASTKNSTLYRDMPFIASDGMNEKGLFCFSLVVPNSQNTTGTNPGKKDMCGLAIPRYLIDNFEDIEKGINHLKTHYNIFMPTMEHGEHMELHFFCGDANHTYVVEFYDNQLVEKELIDKKYLTNFHMKGVEYNADGSLNYNSVEDYGQGLERYDLITENINKISDINKIKEFLYNKLKFTNLYNSDTLQWKSELVGGNLTIRSPISNFSDLFNRAKAEYFKFERNGKTWFSQHQIIIDTKNNSLIIRCQEESKEFLFNNIF